MEYGFLRLFHLTAGFLWAGFAGFMGWYLMPALKAAGPQAAGAVVRQVMERKLSLFMNVAALVVFLTGIRLYMLSFSMAWLTSGLGLSLTVGAVLALGGEVIGIAVSRPTFMKLTALNAEIKAKGMPPTAEQQAEGERLSAKGARAATLVAWHLLGATVCMAGSRLFATL
ncbi:MAG: hypothetical protein K1X64_19960 [Myxococcaceae bacterium]|nr:hypothetical protein [Myxococcaceae bacterium]